jgi:hypothetical protein
MVAHSGKRRIQRSVPRKVGMNERISARVKRKSLTMKETGRQAGFWLSIVASFWIASCGGGGSSTPPPPPSKATPTVTVTPSLTSITTAQSLTVALTVSGGGSNPTPTGTITLSSGTYASAATTLSSGSTSIVISAGALATGSDTLTASYTPDANSSSTYNGASGTAVVTVTAPSLITPTVTVTPAFLSITTTQQLTVTVAVNGGSSNPAPTGTVTLTSGSYTSAAITLAGIPSSAPIIIPAGALPTGTDSLTVTYAPDANSSSTYNGASGTAVVTVTAPALITPTVTVMPGSNSITTAQSLTVALTVSGGGSNPTPTGMITLISGTYTSATTALSSGSASIVIPAGTLATGSDILTANYTPDANSSSTYKSASGTASVTVTAGGTTYVLTIDSAAPSSGISITVTPQDNNGAGTGTTPFTRTYNSGTQVTLSAALSDNGYSFVSWTGCTSTSSSNCDVTMNANTTVTATYNGPASITSITVTPTTATIGAQQQFTATVKGTGAYSSGVTWTLTCPSCGSLSPGTLSTSGLYTTPYPAPASVTVTATSTMSGYTNVSGSATVTLSPPATATGPALTVDAGNQTGAISPYIYGMNGYVLDTTTATDANITVVRWGGDNTSRYNYQTNVTNSADDYYFENQPNATNQWPDGNFNDLVTTAATHGIKVLGTVPVLGWVSNGDSSGATCSFPVSAYPDQYSIDSSRGCGDGEYTNQTQIPDVAGTAAITSIAEPPPTAPTPPATIGSSWTGDWVTSLVNQFGQGNPSSGNGKGVSNYDLDNEPAWWDAVHRDVHPAASTYDEVTNGGIGTALAIKTADPTAEVDGPVVDYWWNYFYSKEDIESGWSAGPCYQPWSNPVDRAAHGGVPFVEYYLKQFAAAETTYGMRLLDYVDLHTYSAADYPAGSGNSVGLTTAGDTGEQQARLNSTRVFWDPTYTDSSNNYPQPNYSTDPSALSCTVPQQAPQLIPMMQTWVANDYPGTKTAIDEYNFGGMEAINGALTQADILGIFGSYHLDLATLWPTTNYSAQVPGTMAFEIYRNYDGNKSTFGDTALASTSANQGALSVYGAIRTIGASTGTVTVVVINKTYGPLTSTLSLANLPSTVTTAQAYLYSNANLAAIVAQPAVTVTPPVMGGTTSTITNYTFPAQSITLFVVPD